VPNNGFVKDVEKQKIPDISGNPDISEILS